MVGSLHIIFGPMFSGKTNKIIDLYNIYNKQYTCFCINYDKDIRYGSNQIISHDGRGIPCISVNNLSELGLNYKTELINSEYLFINEAQFFKDLKTWVIEHIEHYNKNIVICGLDSDFKRNKFGDILDLIPYADKITKLSGKCYKCNNKSKFSHRLTKENEQEIIGADNYIPLCSRCYIGGIELSPSITKGVALPQNT